MSNFPSVKPKDLLKILEKIGFYIHHQTGSHIILKKVNDDTRVIIPFHNKDLKLGTLMNIIKQANLTKKGFFELVGR
jgi:predicted RNA binding protein YcfA (HicA-like mRNA interferase family)